MATYKISMNVDGMKIYTLVDILPDPPGLQILFVGKTPAEESVDKGHYFQGRHGRIFWNRLNEYGIMESKTKYEDESLLDHGYGITDIVKAPRNYGNEPSTAEYRSGLPRIMTVIQNHHPQVLVFIYKAVLDRILKLRFGVTKKAGYGFNPDLDDHFNSRVFVFPMPGTPCTKGEGVRVMKELGTLVEGL